MEDQTVEKTRWECQDYINALEEEQRKIEVFHRELPLTMQIVTQAIENCRQQLAAASFFPSRSDLEGTSTHRPVLEEFIPVRPSSILEEEKSKEMTEEATKNPDWLRSVQLWNQDASPPSEEDTRPKTPPTVGKMNSGAFHPFHKEASSTLVATANSTVEMGGSKGDEKTEPSQRKPRRCWSSDLHRLFLSALQQLGGSHVATPKQIRELMNVDGLTNDEVKSHLQKYRLHSRRPALSFQNSSSSPQFVVVGGIWVPPPEYAAAAAAATMTTGSKETNEAPTNKIYAPIATLPKGAHSQHQQHKHDQQSPTGPLHSEGWASPEHDHANPNSPTTSSS